MGEIEVKVGPRQVFGVILIAVGVVIILHAVLRAVMGIDEIVNLIGTTITEFQGLLEMLGWFFAMLIEVIGGFLIASIGTKILKRQT